MLYAHPRLIAEKCVALSTDKSCLPNRFGAQQVHDRMDDPTQLLPFHRVPLPYFVRVDERSSRANHATQVCEAWRTSWQSHTVGSYDTTGGTTTQLVWGDIPRRCGREHAKVLDASPVFRQLRQ